MRLSFVVYERRSGPSCLGYRVGVGSGASKKVKQRPTADFFLCYASFAFLCAPPCFLRRMYALGVCIGMRVQMSMRAGTQMRTVEEEKQPSMKYGKAGRRRRRRGARTRDCTDNTSEKVFEAV